ncbi:hypothetical protein DFA_01173 [Cavenderia fasciculata]|uniref:Uncharacterized protein n=1 Tax=Cavenderia fasciculata TaxID=261658 RepID=F4PR92_CACFS|nr:uncharacterized protein DFA_01173 [Cavenderia fasciculata]EGG21292.1 hypothetical protein DFA_01173 [Cavenderia fasciculata]|eukprot:XP_004359142.1 hypothetical protein DFA_01173 [Cavenderia fasciculata]
MHRLILMIFGCNSLNVIQQKVIRFAPGIDCTQGCDFNNPLAWIGETVPNGPNDIAVIDFSNSPFFIGPQIIFVKDVIMVGGLYLDTNDVNPIEFQVFEDIKITGNFDILQYVTVKTMGSNGNIMTGGNTSIMETSALDINIGSIFATSKLLAQPNSNVSITAATLDGDIIVSSGVLNLDNVSVLGSLLANNSIVTINQSISIQGDTIFDGDCSVILSLDQLSSSPNTGVPLMGVGFLTFSTETTLELRIQPTTLVEPNSTYYIASSSNPIQLKNPTIQCIITLPTGLPLQIEYSFSLDYKDLSYYLVLNTQPTNQPTSSIDNEYE